MRAIAQLKARAAMMGRAPEVTVVTIKKELVQTYRELPARVNAFRISPIRPQVEGVLKERTFEEGSLVKEGDQLYQIDPTRYDIALKNAKTSFNTLKARRDRYRLLLKEDAISQQEFDDSQSQFAQAEADYNLALTNSNYAKVLAPITGYVGKSNVTPGILVTANQAEVLTTITQLDPVYVDMIQPSKEAVQSPAQKEMTISILVDQEKYDKEGKLKLIEKFADEATDSVRLRAEMPNPDGKLIPGMFVTARLHLPTFEALTIAQRVTTRTPNGGLAVFVIENGIAKQRLIKVAQMVENKFVVVDGLQEGDQVVFEGLQKIADGTPVTIAQPAAPTNAGAPTQVPSAAQANPGDKK